MGQSRHTPPYLGVRDIWTFLGTSLPVSHLGGVWMDWVGSWAVSGSLSWYMDQGEKPKFFLLVGELRFKRIMQVTAVLLTGR